MMTNEQFDRFIINLKLLNAKERDHLMRYAYLGETKQYDETKEHNEIKGYLSPEFMTQLLDDHTESLGITNKAECVFAGMDYHIDWFYVALKFAIEMPDFEITPLEPSKRTKHIKHIKPTGMSDADFQDKFKLDPPPLGDSLYRDFRALTGSQEDIDLIAVFKDKSKYAIFFIEAKGRSAFDRVQLARKLIRLDHILIKTGVVIKDESGLILKDAEPLINFRLILAAPPLKESRPVIKKSTNRKKELFVCKNCREFAEDLPDDKKFKSMKESLGHEKHLSGIGEGLHFMEITNFPKTTLAIERQRDDSDSFIKWEFSVR